MVLFQRVYKKKTLEDILINSCVYSRTCFADSFLITNVTQGKSYFNKL